MRGWLCLALCLLAQATTAPTTAPTTKPTAPPTPQNASFDIPKLPISKANALYPDCRAELIFVVDVSGSVSPPNQRTMLRFVVKFMIAIEQNIMEARFGVVIFGIRYVDRTTRTKWYDRTEFGEPIQYVDPPYGNANVTSSELLIGLSNLSYGCRECIALNRPTWSQLDMMYSLTYTGHLTPTWDGLYIAKTEYDLNGDKTVPGRFIVLITDGIPNDVSGDCTPPLQTPTQSQCVQPILKTDFAVNSTKNGTLLITVGMELENSTQKLMTAWASQPTDILAVPRIEYSKLGDLITKILPIMCPKGAGIECLAEDATEVDVIGEGFLNTGTLFCRFFRDGEDYTADHTTRGIYRNATKISCPIPTNNWFPGEWNMEYTRDGRGYYKAARFKTGTLCRPELLVIWWPFCALALLPLAFCRPKKVAPVTATKTSRGVARPAPAATEEYEEYEEVEEIVAPPEPVNKWKVAPTAYIGFGRARMSVDWAGVAPESAPHEGVRKKVVKKVVSDHAPVPTAGAVPVPAAVEEAPQETVSHSRPQTVEEPDWVNSCLDRVAAIFCCCCVGKK